MYRCVGYVSWIGNLLRLSYPFSGRSSPKTVQPQAKDGRGQSGGVVKQGSERS